MGDGERLWSLVQKATIAGDTVQGLVRQSVLRVVPDATDSMKSDKLVCILSTLMLSKLNKMSRNF